MKNYKEMPKIGKFYVKKPIPIQALQINEPFTCMSLEGKLTGKAGDYLMKGIKGELYICEKTIFEESYDIDVSDPRDVHCPMCGRIAMEEDASGDEKLVNVLIRCDHCQTKVIIQAGTQIVDKVKLKSVSKNKNSKTEPK